MISVFRDKSFCIRLSFLLTLSALFFLLSCSDDAPGLRVECNVEGAEVFLNEQRIGMCPLKYKPKPGKYKLTIHKEIDDDNHYLYEDDISIFEHATFKINAKLSRRFTEKAINEIDKNSILVNGGCFQLGDVFGDGLLDEKPAHEVCIDDFYIWKYEMTQTEWQNVMGNNPSRFKFHKNPIENISYYDVQEFIEKFNDLSGRKYRLPTEAEWEYAARSGGKKEKWAGTNDKGELSGYAWYRDNLDGYTHMVGLKKPNGLGLYDMSGNVEEMVQDRWGEYQSQPQRNPQGPDPVGRFNTVIRGGSYGSGSDEMRVFARRGNAIDVGRFYVGFRLARSAENKSDKK